MTVEKSRGHVYSVLPRSGSLEPVGPAASRTEGRTADGKFGPGNPHAGTASWRSLVAESFGDLTDKDATSVERRSARYFRAFMRDLPTDNTTVRALVAQRARAAALADFFSLRAHEVGLDSDEAARCLNEALKWDLRAEKLAVTSLDVSTRMATRRRKVIDVHSEVFADFKSTP